MAHRVTKCGQPSERALVLRALIGAQRRDVTVVVGTIVNNASIVVVPANGITKIYLYINIHE